MRNYETGQPVGECRGEHQEDEDWLRPSVKGVTSDDQDDVAPAQRSPMKGVVTPQCQRQEVKEKEV
jgi:hypothetical protein